MQLRILTFDLEDWFHLLDHSSTKSEKQWNRFPSRFPPNIDKILYLLDNHSIKATFFCLGWITRKYPEIIREIFENGHTIGCHSDMHQLVFEQSPKEFGKDLDKAMKSLEDTIGQKVKYFRAPGFSINENTAWAFEYLINAGIEIDSSVFPATRAHGGFPEFPGDSPSIISFKGMKIKEFPINIKPILKRPMVFSGGGYFRLFPYPLIYKFTKESNYIMTYFHPRDFDPDQPMIPGLNFKRKFKSYYGLGSSCYKLERWITDFIFTDISTADHMIDWTEVPEIVIA